MKLTSRYGDEYTLSITKTGDYFFKYIDHLRELHEHDGTVIAIDPPGGPLLMCDHFISDGEILRKITKGKHGYFLHFEPTLELDELRGLDLNDIY